MGGTGFLLGLVPEEIANIGRFKAFSRSSCEAPVFVSCGTVILSRAAVVESKVDGRAGLTFCKRRRLGSLIRFLKIHNHSSC